MKLGDPHPYREMKKKAACQGSIGVAAKSKILTDKQKLVGK